MKPGRAPHYRLRAVKAAFGDVSRLNWTVTAAAEADDLGMNVPVVLDVIARLAARDFEVDALEGND